MTATSKAKGMKRDNDIADSVLAIGRSVVPSVPRIDIRTPRAISETCNCSQRLSCCVAAEDVYDFG
ncbi:hypothetical protein GCM10007863_10320 [Dyella mobilis]|nr:hypothetical protein GCM10007863_10320 [Dyella mobilis]